VAGDEEVFGQYRLLRRLAFGGMAEVYLASMQREHGFEKRVVVKRILPQFSGDADFVRMFTDEALLAGRLTHPNVVQIYDFGSVDGVYFLAMEYVDGVDLRQLLREAKERRRSLSPAEIAAIGESVARGLAYAHAFCDERQGPLGLVHRDISPHNILLSRSGDVKITDFGIAKAAARATRTAAGVIKGKLAYMAPEQAAGLALDQRCDQYALGIVLWECATFQPLFDAPSDLELMQQVAAGEARPLREMRVDVPAALDATIMRLLAREPEARFGSMQAVEQALASFRFSLGREGAVRLGELVEQLVPAERQTLDDEGPSPERDAAAPAAAPPLEGRGCSEGASVREAEPEAPPDEVESTLVVRPASRWRAPPRAVAAALGLVAGPALALGLWSLRGDSTAVKAATIRPVARRGTLAIASQPAGAAIAIDGLPSGLTTPVSLAAGALPAQFDLELRLAGFASWKKKAAANQGALTALLLPAEGLPRATLTAAPTAPAAPAPDSSPAPVALPAPRPAPGPRPTATAAARARAQPATSYLSLRSLGAWVEVYLHGRKLGTTPLVRAPVPAGTLTLRLRNADAGIDRTLEVQVSPAEEAQATVSP
jgi:eukaryotic-like serine/threonine-protein kinase